MFPMEEYQAAIHTLEKCMTQLEPDGNNCAYCSDNDHQAFECRFNPLVAMKLRNTFLCYHCGKRFEGKAAREHFGHPEQSPTCIPGLLTMYRKTLETIATRNYPTGNTAEDIASQALPKPAQALRQKG